jgi:Mg2+-importing ATPase
VVIDDLKHWFSRFLRRRRALQHFGRHPLVDTLAPHGPAQAVPADLAKSLMQVALEDTPAALARFRSDGRGLSASESVARLLRDGPNEVAHEKPLPGWLHLCPI